MSGCTASGRHVSAGDKVSVNDYITIQVGNGQRDSTEMVNYTDAPEPEYDMEPEEESGDVDEFHEVTGPEQ